MRLERLVNIGIRGLVGRARQATSMRLDRIRNLNGRDDAMVTPWAVKVSPPEVIEAYVQNRDVTDVTPWLLPRFRESGHHRFFEGAVTDSIPSLVAGKAPETRRQLLNTAYAVRQGYFDVLGYHGLHFGNPPDWHLDPISEKRAPSVHWSRLNPLDPNVVGDSKVIWELNRHQWLVCLGQAYRLTGDERHAETAAQYVQDWIKANPPGVGINWASSLEVAFRVISWCWALFLFRNSKALTRELFLAMHRGIWQHATHVEKYLSYYFSPNTHLTGEALGLFYAGVVFPELQGAQRWRTLGARILVDQCERQIFPDGVYFEHSTCYQRYTGEIYLHFLILAARNGVEVPQFVGDRVQQMLDFLLAVRRPDGSMPQIGDADGGWLLPLAPRTPDDVRGVFSTAAAFFDRQDYAWAACGIAPETAWLLGERGTEIFETLHPVPPNTAPSRLFSDGGYIVMRSGWESEAHHLIFDVGPLGCPVSGGHGHADLLSIQVSVFGEPHLVDSGTYGYASAPVWRNYFRSTFAHNTVAVDGLSQAVPAGPFAWKARPRAHLRRWVSTKDYDFADAEHDAYRRLADPVTHRRRVIFVRRRYWVVIDDLDGNAEHQVEVRFQFAPIEVVHESGQWSRALGSNGHGLLLGAFADVPLKTDLVKGAIEPCRGWVSSDYGVREPAPLLVYSATARLPLRVLTLLVPVWVPSEVPDVFHDLAAAGMEFERDKESYVRTFSLAHSRSSPAVFGESPDSR